MNADTWTHSDAIEFLSDRFESVDQSDRVNRLTSVAVRTAYRDLPNVLAWAYYKRRITLVTAAPYSTGTIEYDHTGGSSERLVTLTSGTFPSWAAYGTLKIGEVSYKVTSRVSGTAITLDTDNNPGDDVASGTAYTLYRSQYPLPNGFRNVAGVFDVRQNCELQNVSPGELVALGIGDMTTGNPRCWTARGLVGDYPGRVVLEFWPPPSDAGAIEVSLGNQGRELLLPSSVTAGTVSVSSGSTSVTGSGTSFSTDCVGSIIRFSTAAVNTPTGLHGLYPYSHQSVITARSSTTAITIADAAPQAYSAVKYIISDPIDIEPGSMLTYFLKACSSEIGSMLSIDPRKLAILESERLAALRVAAAADPREMVISQNSQPFWAGWSLADWGEVTSG